MLAITQAAAQVLESYVASADDLPDAGGVRIEQTSGEDGNASLSLSLASEPEPEDAIVEATTFSVFVEPRAAALLDDKVLDAEVKPSGQVGFVVATQR
jgi:Fe-S cluster assembly iron-binding protein IscA